jgi:hypothetical protein
MQRLRSLDRKQQLQQVGERTAARLYGGGRAGGVGHAASQPACTAGSCQSPSYHPLLIRTPPLVPLSGTSNLAAHIEISFHVGVPRPVVPHSAS